MHDCGENFYFLKDVGYFGVRLFFGVSSAYAGMEIVIHCFTPHVFKFQVIMVLNKKSVRTSRSQGPTFLTISYPDRNNRDFH